MKALFPCEGSIVVNKQDLAPMTSFYNMQLLRSNMNEYMKSANAILQVGNFSYIPDNSNFVLDLGYLNTIGRIKTALGIEIPSKVQVQTQGVPNQPTQVVNTGNATMPGTDDDWLNKPITDEDITSNPFFTTLKEVD